MAKNISIAITTTWCKFQFTAFYQDKSQVDPIRQIYNVTAEIETSERAINSIILRDKVAGFVKAAYEGRTFTYSCEDIAKEILQACRLEFCKVSIFSEITKEEYGSSAYMEPK